MAQAGGMSASRVAWVDYAKGLCIILVVAMHSTLGVEAAAGQEGWMHAVVAFAAPFRIPAFFLVAGLFLSRSIDGDWRDFLDRKVVHFAYFYLLWMSIQFAVKAPMLAASGGGAAALPGLYLLALVEPFGTLWFIYLLPLFYVATRLTRGVPVLAVLAMAVALEAAPVTTGATVIDEFAARYVYFYIGYLFCGRVFAFAEMAAARPALAVNLVAGWAVLNHFAVVSGWAAVPGVSLALGLIGAAAVVTVAALLATGDWVAALRFVGHHSLAVYLAFFLPMAVSRTVLLTTGHVSDIGTVSLLVTLEAVIGALVMLWMARRLGGRFLFERPSAFRLTRQPKVALQPAE